MAHSDESWNNARMKTETPTLLEAYPQLREHYVAAGGDNADAVAGELERFFGLTRVTNAPLAMVSPKMDLMWHKFIEFTEDYAPFCQQRYGEMIHHRPRTATTPVPQEAVRNFRELYDAEYGSVPDIWWQDVPADLIAYASGELDVLSPAHRWSGWPGR